MSGSPLSFRSCFQAWTSDWVLCDDSSDGSYDGYDARARIAPVCGLRATTAPARTPLKLGALESALYAARCAFGLMVRSTDPPCGVRPEISSASRWKNSWSLVPARVGSR